MWTGLRTTSSTPDSNSRSVFSSECCSLSAMTGAPVRSRIWRGEMAPSRQSPIRKARTDFRSVSAALDHPFAEFARREAGACHAFAVEK